MGNTRHVSWLALLLAFCLGVGVISNLINVTAPLWGAVVILAAGLLFIGGRALAPKLAELTAKQVQWLVVIVLALLLVGQLLVLKVMPVTVYHDPYRVLAQADQMAAGNQTWQITYFWRYPNNVTLAYLLSLWLRLTNLFGWSTNLAIHVLSLLCLDGFIVLMLQTIKQLSHRNSVLLGALAFVALTPFAYTYYLQVFYSDLPALLLLLIVFRLLWRWPSKTRRQRGYAGAGLVAAVLLGQLLKPNLIVLLPALAVVAVVLGRRHLLKAAKLGVPVLLIALGFGLSVPATQAIRTVSNYHTDPRFELPATSWILMGVTKSSAGKYSGPDVARAIKLHSKTAVQQADLVSIKKRVSALGPVGLIKLWFVKLGILLHVTGIQSWYNGGFRAAPAWYLAHAQFFRQLTAASYAVGTIVLWLNLIWQLVWWRPTYEAHLAVIILLAVVTMLGYLAFHTLLWETEERYGQIVLPLSFFLLGALPVPQRARRLASWPVGVTASLLGGLSLLGGAAWLAKVAPQTTVVAAQRSQLSVQYQAKPRPVAPGTTLTEAVTLHGSANYFSVQIHQGTRVTVALEALASGRRYQLKQAASVYKLKRSLPAGTYRIRVTNATRRAQLVDVVRTARYQLSAQPLVINGTAHRTASLVYTSLNKQKKGVRV